MKVEALKGCFEKTRGVFYFARMCSKIRLHAQGKLPKDYHAALGQGIRWPDMPIFEGAL